MAHNFTLFSINEDFVRALHADVSPLFNNLNYFQNIIQIDKPVFAVIDGTIGDDILVGTPDSDTISGLAGNDSIAGLGGDDTLNGGDGNDTLDGGNGVDTLNGGSGNDNINGGDGNDTLNGGNDNDTLNGESGDDTINGGNGDDILNGGTGNDTLYGGIDDDTLNGESGDDTIYGGNGNDILNGGTGNDTFYGENGVDTLNGGSGNDNINGGDGNDTLEGGDGDDILFGGNGDDALDGGNGFDVASYSSLIVHNFIITIAADGVITLDTNAVASSGQGIDTLTNIEAISVDGLLYDFDLNPIFTENGERAIGSSGNDVYDGLGGNDILEGRDGNDHLTGGAGDDQIFGGTGYDRLIGGTGNDELYGGTDDDVLVGGDGNDILNGGDGGDVVEYTGGTFQDYTITFNANDTITVVAFGNQGTDTLSNIEVLRIDGVEYDFLGNPLAFTEGNDTVTGTAQADELYGRGGDDIINGGGGDDIVDGGMGDDHLMGGAGINTVYGGAGNDIIETSNGVDTSSGGDGSDTFIFHDAATNLGTFLGGSDDEIDTLDFSNLSFGIAINGNAGGAPGTPQASIRTNNVDNILLGKFSGIEAYIGTDFNDSFTNLINNTVYNIYAGGGDDIATVDASGINLAVFYGEAGNDILTGGRGSDLLSGGIGNDILNGHDGIDFASYEGGTFADYTITNNGDGSYTVVAFGNQGTDILRDIEYIRIDGIDYDFSGNTSLFSAAADTVDGTNDVDIFNAGAGDDIVHGNGGNDRIAGGEGADILFGGNGDDRLWGGTGDDELSGGLGADQFMILADSGNDRIMDFETGIDSIVLDEGSYNYSNMKMHQSGSDVVIILSGGTLTLVDINLDEIDSSDFVFRLISETEPLPAKPGISETIETPIIMEELDHFDFDANLSNPTSEPFLRELDIAFDEMSIDGEAFVATRNAFTVTQSNPDRYFDGAEYMFSHIDDEFYALQLQLLDFYSIV